MKITEWWWALVWGSCGWFGSALTAKQGWHSPIGIALSIGIAWGALMMWWCIKRANKEVE